MNGKVLGFYVGNWHLAIPLSLIREIKRNIEFTPVPGGPPEIAGLLNLRGQIVTVFDLQLLMSSNKAKKASEQRGTSCIILKTAGNDNQAGLLIDAAADVWDVTDGMCEPPPANLQGIDASYIKEVIKGDNQLMMLIVLDQILGSSTRGGQLLETQ